MELCKNIKIMNIETSSLPIIMGVSRVPPCTDKFQRHLHKRERQHRISPLKLFKLEHNKSKAPAIPFLSSFSKG